MKARTTWVRVLLSQGCTSFPELLTTMEPWLTTFGMLFGCLLATESNSRKVPNNKIFGNKEA